MRNHVLSALLLCSTSVNAVESVQQHDKPTPLPLCASFERFMESFVGLFKKDTLVEGMESIEEMTTNLLQSAFSIMGGNVEPALYKDGRTHLKFRDERIEQELATLLVQHAHAISITRKAPSSPKADSDEENQAKILTLFAGIVKNFFNIAQDPENRDNVLPNLMGMATGIVEIGSEVIRCGDLTANADLQAINAFVVRLDNAIKQDMLNIVIQKKEELWSMPREI